MAQWVMALASKSKNPGSILGIHTVKRELIPTLSSDLYTWAAASRPTLKNKCNFKQQSQSTCPSCLKTVHKFRPWATKCSYSLQNEETGEEIEEERAVPH